MTPQGCLLTSTYNNPPPNSIMVIREEFLKEERAGDVAQLEDCLPSMH